MKKKDTSRNSHGLERRLRAALPFLFQLIQGQPSAWEWIAKQSDWRVVATLDAQNRSCPRLRFEIICLKTHQRVHAWSQNVMLYGTFEPRVARTAGWLIALAQQRPRCPRCRAQLDLMTRYDGQQFFGCPRWPTCRASISITNEWYQIPDYQTLASQERLAARRSHRYPNTAQTAPINDPFPIAQQCAPLTSCGESPQETQHLQYSPANPSRSARPALQQESPKDPDTITVNDLVSTDDQTENLLKDEVHKNEKDPFSFLH